MKELELVENNIQMIPTTYSRHKSKKEEQLVAILTSGNEAFALMGGGIVEISGENNTSRK